MTDTQYDCFNWLIEPFIQRTISALGPDHIRFVGGCVRDSLIGRPVHDIDAATDLVPDEVMKRLSVSGIKAIPTGIDHGTVTAVVDGRTVEITTLRKDVETDGRRAVVAFATDWKDDAERRDFTVNALYLKADGTLYDPLSGLKDLKARKIRFIGEAKQRILEDSLRILRYFRFQAQLGFAPIDGLTDGVVSECLYLLSDLSVERVTDELFKWINSAAPVPTIKKAHDLGLFKVLGFDACVDALSSFLSEAQKGKLEHKPHVKIWVLFGGKSLSPRHLQKKLRLSNADTRELNEISRAVSRLLGGEAPRAVAFWHGVGFAKIASAMCAVDCEELDGWQPPECPVSAADLLGRGMSPGPEVGKSLRRMEEAWVRSDFKASPTDLLSVGL